jgi:hypothetical protein
MRPAKRHKKLTYEQKHAESLKRYYKMLKAYYDEIDAYRLTLTREYTDYIFRNGCRLKQTSHDQLHHIIPRSLGGTDDPRNLVWLHYAAHATAHEILYKSNRDDVSLRCAAAMLKRNAKKYGYLTAPGSRRVSSIETLYGSTNTDFGWTE